jgi:hypothetical protein
MSDEPVRTVAIREPSLLEHLSAILKDILSKFGI